MDDDKKIRQLAERLCHAIDKAMGSEEIESIVAEIAQAGLDVHMSLDLTIEPASQQAEDQDKPVKPAEWTDRDKAFLKGLKINPEPELD